MQSFIARNDAMGRKSYVINPSDHVQSLTLAAGVAKQVTVPANARMVLVNATAPIWVRFGGPATLPTEDILDGSAPELNPAGRTVKEGETIGLVASTACGVSLSYYS